MDINLLRFICVNHTTFVKKRVTGIKKPQLPLGKRNCGFAATYSKTGD
jgi:hypothetical protein